MFKFDPFSREVDVNPYPLYQRLRDEFPCYWSEDAQCWALSRYADIVAANQDWQTFSSARGNMLDDIPERTGVTLGTSDPPRHDQMRNLIQSAFAKRNIDHLVAPAKALADEMIDAFIDAGRFEFIADFSSPLTVGVLSYVLGIPHDQYELLRRHVVLILQTDPQTRKKTQASMEAFAWLKDYTAAQLEDRRQHPGDDLLSLLIEAEIDGEKLNEREIHMISLTLIMAGVESASSFMAMLALNLADHPDTRRRVVEDPKLLVAAMEESLRFNTSAQRFRRTATRDVELHGQTIHAGDKVLMCYGSGNRDERQFSHPDRYDIDRGAIRHLGLGTGKHFCVGVPIARLLVLAGMERLLERIPEYHRSSDELDWIPSTTFRSPVTLGFEFRR